MDFPKRFSSPAHFLTTLINVLYGKQIKFVSDINPQVFFAYFVVTSFWSRKIYGLVVWRTFLKSVRSNGFSGNWDHEGELPDYYSGLLGLDLFAVAATGFSPASEAFSSVLFSSRFDGPQWRFCSWCSLLFELAARKYLWKSIFSLIN